MVESDERSSAFEQSVAAFAHRPQARWACNEQEHPETGDKYQRRGPAYEIPFPIKRGRCDSSLGGLARKLQGTAADVEWGWRAAHCLPA